MRGSAWHHGVRPELAYRRPVGTPGTTDALSAALAEADRLRAEVVRLHARVQVLEEALAAAYPAPVAPRLRGLASLINNDSRQAQQA
jgi:hypothetical protein